MVLGKKPVQVREFFVGHGRVSHNAGIYRKLLILPSFRRGPRPVSFTVPNLTGVFAPFGAKTDGWRRRGPLRAQIAACPLTIC